MQLPYTMHLRKASTCSTENRPWFHGGYDHQGVPKNLTLYDLAVGWQKVAFGVKANTNTKNVCEILLKNLKKIRIKKLNILMFFAVR